MNETKSKALHDAARRVLNECALNAEENPADRFLADLMLLANHALQSPDFSKEQAERIINSADAQYFRWLLKHHSGSGEAIAGAGMCCWIGGVEFRGEDIRDAIDAAIEAEAKTQGLDHPHDPTGKCGRTGEAGNGSPA
jgi:hypothetical protein